MEINSAATQAHQAALQASAREAKQRSEENIKNAQEDAQDKVAKAQIQADKELRTIRHEVDTRKDQYEKEAVANQIKHEAVMKYEKDRADRTLADIHDVKNHEAHRLLREGEREIGQLNEHYRHQQISKEWEGNKKIKELERQQHEYEEYLRKSAANEVALMTTEHEHQVGQIRGRHEEQKQTLDKTTRAEFERLQSAKKNAFEQSQAKFQDNFDFTSRAQMDTLQNLRKRGDEQIKQTQDANAVRVSTYSAKLSDPFYKLHTLDAQMHENEEAYILKAKIPEYEQNNINLSVKGGQLMVSGYRSSKEQRKTEDGREQESQGYQSFRETFPLALPVEPRMIQKEYSGDTLTITIPKKLTYEPRKSFQKKDVSV